MMASMVVESTAAESMAGESMVAKRSKRVTGAAARMLLWGMALFPAILLADAKLHSVISGEHRSDAEKARDLHRAPYETLQFFGLTPEMRVIESWPAGGWYTQILAPYLKDRGQYIAATFDRDAQTQRPFHARINASFDEKFVARPEIYGDIVTVGLAPPTATDIAAQETVDMVLDFRNAHNWIRRDDPDAVPRAWHKALKQGGIVGLVDHRMDEDREYNPGNGYVHERQIIEIMERNGFRYVARSDILSNPRDTKDHPGGVWNLPPTLSGDESDKDKFLAIGESDRMLLKFVKN